MNEKKKKDHSILKIILLLIALMICFALKGYVTTQLKGEDVTTDTSTISEATSETAPERKHDLTFAAFGDVHDNAPDFQSAIDDLYEIDPILDALVLNGDTVDQGTDSQYETMTNMINDNKDKLPKKILKTIGNHEFYDYENGSNSKEELQEKLNRFLKFAGKDKVYYDEWINNYHFICLGSEDGNSATANTMNAYISDSQINFLKEKINENYENGKPIFVFLHQPLIVNWGDGNQTQVNRSKEINEILSKYPEIIFFNSHTHKELKEDSINKEKKYITIQTGSVSYTFTPKDNSPIYDRNFTKIFGVYVTVDGNSVSINGRNIKDKDWIFNANL